MCLRCLFPPFLAHLAKGHMRYCHTVASVRPLSVVRPSVVHNWEKMLLLQDGWMDMNQTWAQCSPSGGASGLCSAFGSGSGSESQKSVIKCDTRKTLLLLDGWMDLNQTWTQCSPSGGASGLCSAFGSGSGFYVCLKIWHFLHFLTADPILTKLVKYVVHVYMNMCVTPFLDPDRIWEPKKCDKVWYTQNATPPRRLDGLEPNLDTMLP